MVAHFCVFYVIEQYRTLQNNNICIKTYCLTVRWPQPCSFAIAIHILFSNWYQELVSKPGEIAGNKKPRRSGAGAA